MPNKLLEMGYIPLLLILFLVGNKAVAQDYPTKNELKALFGEKQEYLGEVDWKTCNADSAYFKSDTIILYYRNTTCFEMPRCCDYVTWTFHNAEKFQTGTFAPCTEPPISSWTGYNPCKLKIRKSGDQLELRIIDNSRQTQVFQVTQLMRCEGNDSGYGKFGYALTLVSKR